MVIERMQWCHTFCWTQELKWGRESPGPCPHGTLSPASQNPYTPHWDGYPWRLLTSHWSNWFPELCVVSCPVQSFTQTICFSAVPASCLYGIVVSVFFCLAFFIRGYFLYLPMSFCTAIFYFLFSLLHSVNVQQFIN